MAAPSKCQQELFRKMAFELSTRLEKEQCETIHYLARLPNSESSCGVSKSSFQLYVLSSLEANGHISPHNVDYLLELLSTVHREDLLPIVNVYRKSCEYKQLLKMKKRRNEHNVGESDCVTDDLKKRKKHLRPLYALLITHITGMTQVMEMLREELDKLGEDEVEQVIERFQKVAEDGQTFTNDLQKVLGDLGIEYKRNSTSSSSEEETSTKAVTMRPKKPKPLPRTHKPVTQSQLSVPVQAEEDARAHDNLVTGTQEESEACSSSLKESSLSQASLPKLHMEEEDDNTGTNTGDSGIGHWIGHRVCSLETDTKLDCSDGGHGEKATHIYTPLMKRKESVPHQYEPVSYGSDMHRQ